MEAIRQEHILNQLLQCFGHHTIQQFNEIIKENNLRQAFLIERNVFKYIKLFYYVVFLDDFIDDFFRHYRKNVPVIKHIYKYFETCKLCKITNSKNKMLINYIIEYCDYSLFEKLAKRNTNLYGSKYFEEINKDGILSLIYANVIMMDQTKFLNKNARIKTYH